MLRWLTRLLLLGLVAAVAAFVVSRLMGQDEDFDDFDDIDAGFEFEETPVEIDVPADDATGGSTATGTSASGGSGAGTVDLASDGMGSTDATRGSASEGMVGGLRTVEDLDAAEETREPEHLTPISGIGPAYEARLHSLGIQSISDLAAADAAELAGQLDVIGGQTTIEDWISQARNYGSSNGQKGSGNGNSQ